MLLTKSCHSKDHIKKRKTIKLATLDHYRKTEIQQIADKDEGRITFDIFIDTITEVHTKWFNTIMSGSMTFSDDPEYEAVRFPGSTKITCKNLSIVSTGIPVTVISKADIHIEREAPDSLIFCMSQARETSDCRNIFPDYDSEWHIRETSKHDFAMEIFKSLIETLRTPARGGLIPTDIPLEELGLICNHAPVIYAPRSIHITQHSSLKLETILEHMETMAYLKPEKFKIEQEYRFVFFITHKNEYLALRKDSVILNMPDGCISLTF